MPDSTYKPKFSHHKIPSTVRRDYYRSVDRLNSHIDSSGAPSSMGYVCMSLSNTVCNHSDINKSDTNMEHKQTMTDGFPDKNVFGFEQMSSMNNTSTTEIKKVQIPLK